MPATEKQIEINRLYREHGFNSSAVAKKTNLSVSAINKHLFYGARNGLSVVPDNYSEVAPIGWSSYAKSILHKDGEVKLVWDKVRPDNQSEEDLLAFFENRVPVIKKIPPPPKQYADDLMLEWKLFDHHLGLHSWAKQTGDDYSIKHAQYLIESAASHIYKNHGNVDTSVIILGGDNMHSDNRSAITEKSKHHLDVDSRYEKSLDALYASIVTAIDIALTKSKKVVVFVLSGNHDYHAAIAMSRILNAHYRLVDRVSIDTTPSKHRFFRWGSNFFMYTHGETAPANRLSGFMLNHIIKNNITGVKRKLVRKGHIHKQGKVFPPGLTEEDGVIIETFQTLAAPDSYSIESAYVGIRATVAEIWHNKWGQRSRMELGVDELMMGFKA